MNLFYLDEDLKLCAQYHIDRHVGKMQLEAAQLMTTTLWVDKILGFVPRKLTSEELAEINKAKALEPDIEERTFTRYLPTHINHPSAIWARSGLLQHEWIFNYVYELNTETQFRGNKSHASCAEVIRMPDPQRLPTTSWSTPTLAMPEGLKSDDAVASYRLFYMLDKHPFASWKVRGKPWWWDDSIVAEQQGRISGR